MSLCVDICSEKLYSEFTELECTVPANIICGSDFDDTYIADVDIALTMNLWYVVLPLWSPW